MRSYGIELYAEEVTRDLLRNAEQERRLRDAMRLARETTAPEATAGQDRPRFSRSRTLRRFAGLKWSW